MCVCVCMGGHGCLFFSLFLFARVKDAAQPHHYAHVRPSEAVKMAAPCVMCTGLSNICTELQRWDAYMWATFFFFFGVKWNQSHFSAGFVSSKSFFTRTSRSLCVCPNSLERAWPSAWHGRKVWCFALLGEALGRTAQYKLFWKTVVDHCVGVFFLKVYAFLFPNV